MDLLTALLVAAVGVAAGWLGRSYVGRRTSRAPEPPPRPSSPEPDLVPPRSLEPRASAGRGPPRLSEGATTSRRILVHLYGLGRLEDGEVAPFGFTQAGMAEALALGQGTLAKALSRLEAAEIVRVDRRHVAGAPTRRKVYRLTGQGVAVARDIARRPGTPPNPRLPGGR